jgi:hypothetical protein
MKPAVVTPRHVGACQHSPLKGERWFVHTWKRDGGGDHQTRIPYSCNSWRCRVCQRHEAAVTFARIREASEGLDPRGWCFLVATIDRDGYYSGEPWADTDAAYKALGKMSAALLGRIGRRWGHETRLVGKKRRRVVRRLGNRWVSVVEAHRSGWPHVNIAVWCPELAAELRADRLARLEDPELADAVELARDAWSRKEPIAPAIREKARRATLVGGELRDMFADSGWGVQSSAEAANDAAAVASYIVGLMKLHETSAGELSKITQAPTNAPGRFRRLRSGKGFLPPRRSNPAVTGCLVRRRRSHQGDWQILPVNPPKDPAESAAVDRAIRVELQIIDEEERILSRNRGQIPPMPPMRHAVRGELEPHVETSERRAALLSRGLSQVA